MASWILRSSSEQSLQLAREFIASGQAMAIIPGSIDGLVAIHAAIFAGIYEHAGKIRKLNLAKGNFRFASCLYLKEALAAIEKMPDSSYEEIIDKYAELNVAHPFMEGNGRAGRIWLDLLLKARLGLIVGWSLVDKWQYLQAMERSSVNTLELGELLRPALTAQIADREMIFKGLEVSYYYEL